MKTEAKPVLRSRRWSAAELLAKIVTDCDAGNVSEESVIMSCAYALLKGGHHNWAYACLAIRRRFRTDEDPYGIDTQKRIYGIAVDCMMGKKPMPLRPGYIYTSHATRSGARWRMEAVVNPQGVQEFSLYRNNALYAAGLPWDGLYESIRNVYPTEALVAGQLRRVVPAELAQPLSG